MNSVRPALRGRVPRSRGRLVEHSEAGPSAPALSSHIRPRLAPKRCSLGKTITRVNRHKQEHILTLSRRPDVTERDT
ncbi:hypothetical protein EYF80_021774 [Liparis tanakae]|uniref:Uncharacterized protein n=1 Tax=Liparis tanakae TaxID=230148 RepID=A0A4Z2HT13_9TELE|nr:hypothetical protein EYF80_021774 [Liparis tanakae]